MRANYLLFSALAIVLWGFIGKLALQRHMSPISVFFAEVIVSIVCTLVVVVISRPNLHGLYNSSNVFGLLSGAGLALGLLCYYFALSRGQATIIVPLTACYPVVTVALSYGFLNERPTRSQLAGVVLVAVGLTLLLSGPILKAANK